MDFYLMPQTVKEAGKILTDQCHGLAKQSGWWHDIKTGLPLDKNVGELLMLCVSELAEAMEGHRKNLVDDHLTNYSMLTVELADCVIRIFDMAGGLDLNVAGAISNKLIYNSSRADHKPENRALENGKKY